MVAIYTMRRHGSVQHQFHPFVQSGGERGATFAPSLLALQCVHHLTIHSSQMKLRICTRVHLVRINNDMLTSPKQGVIAKLRCIRLAYRVIAVQALFRHGMSRINDKGVHLVLLTHSASTHPLASTRHSARFKMV